MKLPLFRLLEHGRTRSVLLHRDCLGLASMKALPPWSYSLTAKSQLNCSWCNERSLFTKPVLLCGSLVSNTVFQSQRKLLFKAPVPGEAGSWNSQLQMSLLKHGKAQVGFAGPINLIPTSRFLAALQDYSGGVALAAPAFSCNAIFDPTTVRFGP